MISHLRAAMIKAHIPLRVADSVLDVIEESKIYSISPHRKYVIIAENMGTLRISSQDELERKGTNLSIDVFGKRFKTPDDKKWIPILTKKTKNKQFDEV